MPKSLLKSSRDSVRYVVSIVLLVAFIGGHAPSAYSKQPRQKEVVVHSHMFSFSPSEITLKKGENVKLILISDDVPHGLTVDGFGIHATFQKGQPTELTITPSQAGDFSGSCSVFCGNGHRDMELTFHVVD